MAEESRSLLIFPELPAPPRSEKLMVSEEGKHTRTIVEQMGDAFAELGFRVLQRSKKQLVISSTRKQISVFLSRESEKERL